MDSFFTTFIFMVLAAALAVTLYLLYRSKSSNPITFIRRRIKGEKTVSNTYQLFYNNEDTVTRGPDELYVFISNARNPQHKTKSVIYHDSALISEYVTIGRDQTNTYAIHEPSIDRFEAIYLAKVGDSYRIRANPESKNGLSFTFLGSRIENAISFETSTTVYMGNLCFTFAVPGYETTARRSRKDIFSDSGSHVENTTRAATETFRARIRRG